MQQERRLAAYGAAARDDALDRQGYRLAVDVDGERVSRHGLQVFGCRRVDIDLAQGQLFDADIAAVFKLKAAEAVESVRVYAGNLHPAFAAGGALVYRRGNLRQAGGEAVDAVNAREFLLQGSEALHRHVSGPAELVVLACAGRYYEHVDGAQPVDHGLSDGEGEGVAGAE